VAGFGAAVLYSAAGGHFEPWAGKHVLRFGIFLGMVIIMSRMKLEFWKSITLPLYLLLLFLLIVVELLGFVGGGSQRWIHLGIITLQPSELMKPVMVLAAAWFFDRLPPNRMFGIEAVWPLGALLLLPSALVIIQPDFDAAIAYAFGLGIVGFMAGLPLIYFWGAGAGIAVLAPLVYFFGLKPYQQDRVLIFLNPENDPLGAGYHITQSKIAIGSGGIFGKGFGNGTQSHLDYRLRLCHHGRRMGHRRRLLHPVSLFPAHALGLDCRDAKQDPLWPIGRRWPDLHDFLLHHDQPVDGRGPCPCCRHSFALCQSWREFDADDDAVRRRHHVHRTPPRRKARPIPINRVRRA
jgi:hypothetical protein